MKPIEKLVSLPASVAETFAALDPGRAAEMFVVSDPPGCQLGSGGGTAHLLVEAWRASQKPAAKSGPAGFSEWLTGSRKLIVHGSGESRRLPAYAVQGKPLIPMPALRARHGHRPGQVLLDLQLRTYERLFWHAPASYITMVACGDVLLRSDHWLPRYPQADVLILGIAASPEELEHHGAIFCPLARPTDMDFFLQKPPAERIRALARSHLSFLDTGVWLLTARALQVLMTKCGWIPGQASFKLGQVEPYELYAAFGPALGAKPVQPEREISALTCAVLPLPEARFYHFGTNRSLLTSTIALQRPAAEQRSFDHASFDQAISQVTQHARVASPLTARNPWVWIENATIPGSWTLADRHVLTGVPPNDWTLALEPGVCLDFVPVGSARVCLRFCGFEDSFRGAVSASTTPWFGRPAADWFAQRQIGWAEAGFGPETDLQEAPLFPVVEVGEAEAGFLEWLFAARPPQEQRFRSRWCQNHRLSAQQLLREGKVSELVRQRNGHLRASLTAADPVSWLRHCEQHDLEATAKLCQAQQWDLPEVGRAPDGLPTLAVVHDRMCRSLWAKLRGQPVRSRQTEAEAFEELRRLIVREAELQPVQPTRSVLEDQIVWGRSPVRLDLAGGWTDTPPYCLERGGRVVNVAVDLNGQPPIQVFGRVSGRPGILLRSIDLGLDEPLESYDDIRQAGQLGSGFGIARAALALAGFEPRFHARGGYRSLQEQLEKEIGGGLELSLLAAVPKGSGLGASSILAATLLGTLSEMLGLRWSQNDLFSRTLALEQMLTSGGGWQDQAGGVAGGLKLVETEASLAQKIIIRWLPGQFFSGTYANHQTLLYYTGLTRVAHDILGEIVKGLFLNSATHLGIIEDIGQNALFAADAIQRNDWADLCLAVRRSWELNQRLDAGTNPPPVNAILQKIEDYVAATKLLGAGGGGYMLILAKDPEAAQRIRTILAQDPPNTRARFVDLALSTSGFQVTRS